MPNRLANESSPYLLQHANNPVDWYPWCEEAIERAKREQKPIFLSIGYSACHWCHVMEHESFEDPEIAKILNEHFVPIKVDREERPDLDQIYMNAVQILTGRGGWPMSVFLTPDLKPFFGGTYWPPRARPGLHSPGFDQVLHAVLDAWQNRRDQAIAQASDLTARITSISQPQFGDDKTHMLEESILDAAATKLEQNFDFAHGGFGGAPKFPHAMDLQFLLRVWRRTKRDEMLQMVRLTLEKMARGGIYDHLGGGFARYSVDAKWLVPHFEKMLYDNGLLASVYIEMYQITHEDLFREVATETLDYLLRDMRDPAGGFHSAEDADSEGVEGKFYVWSKQEIVELLGPEAAEKFCYVYGVTEQGNFEGLNILNLPKSVEQCAQLKGWDAAELHRDLQEWKRILLEHRAHRVRPAKDDKVLVSWNGLVIEALAKAAIVFDRDDYRTAATEAATFIRSKMVRPDGRLLHSYRNGVAKLDAYLDDYTNLANALVTLYEATFDEDWLRWSDELMATVLNHFKSSSGGFYFTADDHEKLITRTIDWYDHAAPSGNAMAATALIRLGKITGRPELTEEAAGVVRRAIPIMTSAPAAAGQMLIAADMLVSPFYQLVVLGGLSADEDRLVLTAIGQRYLPNHVTVYWPYGETVESASVVKPLLQGRSAVDGVVTTYICEDQTCEAPLVGVDSAVERITHLV